MKELSLGNYLVEELNSNELQDTEGGNPWLMWWGAAMTVIALHDAVDQISDGWNKEHNKSK